jgi:hypothetical protein
LAAEVSLPRFRVRREKVSPWKRCVSLLAHAADMPIEKGSARFLPPYNWTGFYLGANLGGAWSNGSLNIPWQQPV